MDNGFYRAFEEKYYAPRSVIMQLRRQYLPFVEQVCSFYPEAETFDLGCGRGEWLELMLEMGLKPFGVDLDEGMLQDCREYNLPAQKGDAVAYLTTIPDNSQIVVSAFHVVEHITFEQLQTVVSEALRVLKPGGLLIMETPNPENIVVATRNFFIDPTHKRPIPAELLSFLPEFYGFARTKIMRLQESKQLSEKVVPSLNDIFSGVSPDYAVVAQKTAPDEMLACLDEVFSQEYGLPFKTLAERFDKRLLQAEEKAQQAEEKAQLAEEKAQRAEIGLHAVYNSYSWRITLPFRLASEAVRWFARGSMAWLNFAPMSRPRRGARNILLSLKAYVTARPFLKKPLLRVLARFPRLESHFRGFGKNRQLPARNVAESPENLSPLARKIYRKLLLAVENGKRDR